MASIAERVAAHPFFAGLSPEAIDLIVGCAANVRFRAGERLFGEGDPAETFYVVRGGRIALEMRAPTGSKVLDTVEADEVVGWSWLVPPYRWTFDGRAIDDVRALSFDGACLRGKCEDDPELGYTLLTRVVGVMSARLHSARVRVLDLYGGP